MALCFACRVGDDDALDWLLDTAKTKLDPAQVVPDSDGDPMCAFSMAMDGGFPALLPRLFAAYGSDDAARRRGANAWLKAAPNRSTGIGSFPLLCVAIARGLAPAVRCLLDNGADPNVKDSSPPDAGCGAYMTPLHLAIAMQRPEIVRELLRAPSSPGAVRCNPNCMNGAGCTALMFSASQASAANGAAVMSALLEGGALPDTAAAASGERAIDMVMPHYTDCFRALIKAGADLTPRANRLTGDGGRGGRRSYVHSAAAINAAGTLEVVLAAGADPNVAAPQSQDYDGSPAIVTPLDCAAIADAADAVRVLLAHGAAVEGCLDPRVPPLSASLLPAGRVTRRSPLATAALYGSLHVAAALLRSGADPNTPIRAPAGMATKPPPAPSKAGWKERERADAAAAAEESVLCFVVAEGSPLVSPLNGATCSAWMANLVTNRVNAAHPELKHQIRTFTSSAAGQREYMAALKKLRDVAPELLRHSLAARGKAKDAPLIDFTATVHSRPTDTCVFFAMPLAQALIIYGTSYAADLVGAAMTYGNDATPAPPPGWTRPVDVANHLSMNVLHAACQCAPLPVLKAVLAAPGVARLARLKNAEGNVPLHDCLNREGRDRKAEVFLCVAAVAAATGFTAAEFASPEFADVSIEPRTNTLRALLASAVVNAAECMSGLKVPVATLPAAGHMKQPEWDALLSRPARACRCGGHFDLGPVAATMAGRCTVRDALGMAGAEAAAKASGMAGGVGDALRVYYDEMAFCTCCDHPGRPAISGGRGH